MSEERYAKIAKMICNDYAIMMDMLESVNPKNGITAKTLPILELVRRVFIDALEKNISGMFQAKAVKNAMDKADMSDEETSCEIEPVSEDEDDEEEVEEDTDFKDFYD